MRPALLPSMLLLLALALPAIARDEAPAEIPALSHSTTVQSPEACRVQAATFLARIPEPARIPIPPLPFEHAQEGPEGTLVLLCQQDGPSWHFLGAWLAR